jgi:hypothetical protein
MEVVGSVLMVVGLAFAAILTGADRTSSTFSCDIAYSRSPTASRAWARSR